MNEVIIESKFKFRDYQLPIADALENKGYKKIICIMARRCLSADTHIIMSDGSYKLLKDIEPGDSILSWNGESFVADIVKNKWKTGTKKTLKIKSSKFPSIITSVDHKFATKVCGRDKVSWKNASTISKYDNVMHYAGTSSGTNSDPDMAEFLGYMHSDGYVSGYQQPKFTNINIDILKRVEYLVDKLFGYKAIWRPKGNGYDLGLTNGTNGGGYNKNKIKELFRSDGQDVPKSRSRLHSMLWNFDEKSLGRFFAALISSDGSLYANDSKRNTSDGKIFPPTLELSISCGLSYEYAWDIYWLLRKIGIVINAPYKEKDSNWRLRLYSGTSIKKLLSYGRIYGKEEKQERMLSIIDSYTLTRNVFKGCYESRAKIDESEPEELYDIETELNHNFVANGYLVHNSGKDILAFNLMIRAALRDVGIYLYCLPTYRHARGVIFDSITNDGTRFLDYIPKEFVTSINASDLRITLINGSQISLIGSDSYDNSIVGTNARMIVFSEWALCDERAYTLGAKPILAANGGTVIFLSTPRGQNHLYDLWKMAKKNPEWFCYMTTVEDTKHISLDLIKREIESGEISEDLAKQEYYCDFFMGQEGSYYNKYMDRLRLNGQIGKVNWDPSFKVNTAWDIGMRDSTSIIFFQVCGTNIHIIDSYERSKEGLEHYVQVINSKPYQYGKHIGPHDLRVREFTSGIARVDKARQLGINFTIADNLSIEDGIEAVRTALPKMYIDETKCSGLIKALENYRQEYDQKKKVYKSQPLHDQFSHMADAMRYLAISLPKMRDGMTVEDIKKLRAQAYGDNTPYGNFGHPTQEEYDRNRSNQW